MSQLVDALGEPPNMIETFVTVCAALVAVAAASKIPWVRRPVAWVLRRNIGEPVADTLRRIVNEEATLVIQNELKKENGGASIPDLGAQIAELDAKVQTRLDYDETLLQLHQYTHENIHRLNNLLGPKVAEHELMWRDYGDRHPK